MSGIYSFRQDFPVSDVECFLICLIDEYHFRKWGDQSLIEGTLLLSSGTKNVVYQDSFKIPQLSADVLLYVAFAIHHGSNGK